MRAAVLREVRGNPAVEDVDEPACPPDGVVVAVRACGVCRSDHHAWAGEDPDVTLPHVMGHEWAGEVLEAGPEVRTVRPGDRVTAPFILACGTCAECRTGDPTVCADQEVVGFTRPGAFAERVAVPRADFNLVHLPEGMGFDAAAGMGCRVTTAFRGVIDRGGLRPGETLAVHGCGGVGLAAVMLGAAVGARVVAVDVKPEALALAEAFGATDLVTAGPGVDAAAAVREATGGGAHVSVDALGIGETFGASLRSLRRLGRHVQIGMPVGRHATVELPLQELVYARQLTLHGTRGMAAARFPALMAMIAAGRIDPARLVTRRIPLSALHGAMLDLDRHAAAGVTVVDDMAA